MANVPSTPPSGTTANAVRDNQATLSPVFSKTIEYAAHALEMIGFYKISTPRFGDNYILAAHPHDAVETDYYFGDACGCGCGAGEELKFEDYPTAIESMNPGKPDFNAPLEEYTLALQGNYQTPVVTLLPSVDIDIDSDNNGTIEGTELEDKVETTAPGKVIKLNIDDDDENGTPDHEDEGAYTEIDDDLVPVELSYEDVDADLTGMQLKLSHGAGVKLWTTQKKDAPLPLEFTIGSDTIPTTFYVEGTDTGQPSITATLQVPDSTGFVALHVDEVMTTVMDLDLQAHRPLTEGPNPLETLPTYGNPFPKTAVPEKSEETPGVGIRRNGDDDDEDGMDDRDRNDTGIVNENDLVEVLAAIAPVSPDGITYVLRRTNDNINVWDHSNKLIPILTDNEAVEVDDLLPTNDTDGALRVWVEWAKMGETQTESQLILEARTNVNDPQSVVAADTLRFHPFTSVVIAFGGNGHHPEDTDNDGSIGDIAPGADNPNNREGAFDIAQDLYEAGWDVHAYDEEIADEPNNTFDQSVAFNEVVSATQNRGVTDVAIFGYSHGGGATYGVADALNTNDVNVNFAAYIDAVVHDFTAQENRFPRGTDYLLNIFQENDATELGGGPIDTDNMVAGELLEQINVTQAAGWNNDLDHHLIDDDAQVQERVRTRLDERINR